MRIKSKGKVFHPAILLLLSVTPPNLFTALSQGVRDAPPQRVVTLEWIPLYAQRKVIEVMKQEIKDASLEKEYSIESIGVFGDEEDLEKQLEGLRADPPDAVVCFGNYLTRRVLNEGPNVPITGVLVRNAQGLVESATRNRENLSVIDSDPDPETIWKLARELKPQLDSLCVLYTAKYEPNEVLVRKLRESGSAYGFRVVSATVGAGFCRTESDFQKALDIVPHSGEVDILYVPDDPNCSRFGSAVYRFSDAKGWPAIGSEATIGKGCVVAIDQPLELIGRELLEVALNLRKYDSRSRVIREIRDSILFDTELAVRWGISSLKPSNLNSVFPAASQPTDPSDRGDM